MLGYGGVGKVKLLKEMRGRELLDEQSALVVSVCDQFVRLDVFDNDPSNRAEKFMYFLWLACG
jgi:hypothetical protein